MRLVITRVHVWPAAKVGAVLGCLSGLIFGVTFVLIGSALSPLGQILDQPVNGIGVSGVVLITLANGSLWCSTFAAGAALYNLAARLGANVAFTAKSPAEEAPSGQESSTERNDPSGLDNCSFATRTFKGGSGEHTS
ncbi:MAG TPA: hypothetical protein PLT86_13980 [Candidatus Latescibacteria bacterium]|mgnify:FL=1|nr:hypothetical protein [Candidatus Latescibacterota bacterium]HQI76407.1 hypothetical protein [Candidatus Latescibacterota bacterium]